MTSAVDTNILMDLLIPGAAGAETAHRVLDDAATQGDLIISEPVYAELGAIFPGQHDLEQFLTTTGLRLVPSDRVVLWHAGEAWRQYRQRRPSRLECPRCGTGQTVSCTGCGASLNPRQHVLADFLIGAPAQRFADCLLTRDRRYYRTYFPGLTVRQP